MAIFDFDPQQQYKPDIKHKREQLKKNRALRSALYDYLEADRYSRLQDKLTLPELIGLLLIEERVLIKAINKLTED